MPSAELDSSHESIRSHHDILHVQQLVTQHISQYCEVRPPHVMSRSGDEVPPPMRSALSSRVQARDITAEFTKAASGLPSNVPATCMFAMLTQHTQHYILGNL